MAGKELDIEPKIHIVNDFLEERIQYFKCYLSEFDIEKQLETEKLDTLFRDTVKRISNIC